jgi:2',3'-cyclic-nucleotide 2'-phosphodiesterase (5'-nucleotidase family)
MKVGIAAKHPYFFLFIIFLVLTLLNSCHKKPNNKEKSFYILSINDVYRTEGLDDGKLGGLARVRSLRKQLTEQGKNVLLLHAGDFLQPSFSSRVNHGAAMIDVMNQLNGTDNAFDENMVVTFGNHEFDKGKLKYLPRLQQSIDESEFTWLDSNINWHHDQQLGFIHSKKLQKWLIKDIAGIKVGLYSLTTDMAHPEYIASFDDPIEVSKHYVSLLRAKGAEIIIALTHQRMSDDKQILAVEPEFRPNLIIGGHEHYRQLEQSNNSWIVKADADALSAAVIQLSIDKYKQVQILPTFTELDADFEKDPAVQQVIENWIQRTNVKYCRKIKNDENCLDYAYGSTKVKLVAEESEIRRFETNMGNYIADTALAEFSYCQADMALVNSGGVRLNYNISANSNITRKHIEGMFPYPTDLKLISINGSILKQMLNHSIDKWTANGHWLLVSGIKFTHNPEQQKFSQLRWSDSNKTMTDQQQLRVVVPQYLIDANTDHDGYDMINESMLLACDKNGADLKQLVIKRIQATANGISPKKDGRICNTQRDACDE